MEFAAQPRVAVALECRVRPSAARKQVRRTRIVRILLATLCKYSILPRVRARYLVHFRATPHGPRKQIATYDYPNKQDRKSGALDSSSHLCHPFAKWNLLRTEYTALFGRRIPPNDRSIWKAFNDLALIRRNLSASRHTRRTTTANAIQNVHTFRPGRTSFGIPPASYC